MKVLGFFLCFIFIATFAFAEVTGKVLSYEQDENGNIMVISEYKLNENRIVSRYPDGNWRTRYSALNFSKEKILGDVKNFCEANVYKEFNTKANLKLIDEQNKLKSDDINKITNLSYKTSTTIQKLDTDNNGIVDTEITFKDDGTKTTNIITP